MTGEAVEDALVLEGQRFGRYLLGRAPSGVLVDRYVAACRALFPDPPESRDAAMVAFARRHPWSLGCLDGAAALVHPGGLLRSKLLVMAAICEAAPGDDFLPRVVAVPSLVMRLGIAGVAAVVQALVGLAVYRFAARSGT